MGGGGKDGKGPPPLLPSFPGNGESGIARRGPDYSRLLFLAHGAEQEGVFDNHHLALQPGLIPADGLQFRDRFFQLL